MSMFTTGEAHHSIAFVVDPDGEHEYVVASCHCEFGSNHYGDPSDPRRADDLDFEEARRTEAVEPTPLPSLSSNITEFMSTGRASA